MKYHKYNFPPEPETKRKAGSDWLKDVTGEWRKLRTWSAVDAEWKLTKTGLAYYKQFQSEWTISIPVHYLIAKPDDHEVGYSGYFPVSQLTTSLRERLQELFTMDMGRGEDRARMIARMKQDTLRQLQTQNFIDHPELGRVAVIHYESDMMAAYRPGTPREFRYSELRLVDGSGRQLEEQRAVLNLPMRGHPVRPNIINAQEISPYSLVETPHNCAVYALSKHCEIPLEKVQEEMKVFFSELHPEETGFLFPLLWYYGGVKT